MHRVVVVTPEGELISDVYLSIEQVDGHVAAFAMINNVGIYVDGRLIQPEEREALLHALVARMQQHCPQQPPQVAAPPEPQEVETWDAIRQRGLAYTAAGYADLQKAQVQSYVQMQELMHRFAEMFMEMQRDLADEAVRQRRLTAASLGDIDLLDRVVKTSRLNQAMASAAGSFARPLAEPKEPKTVARQGLTFGDLFGGFLDFTTGK